jgi:hypothetical protein
MPFIIDSNFFIQAHRVTYPIDVATGFWNKVTNLANHDKILSIDKVKNEIFKNEDELKKWIEINILDHFFKDTQSTEILNNYSDIVNWANSKSGFYLPKAIHDFLEYENADPWLVAFALSSPEEMFVVTHEISEPNKKSKIKIPEVCKDFGIKYVNTIEMFRKLGETF